MDDPDRIANDNVQGQESAMPPNNSPMEGEGVPMPSQIRQALTGMAERIRNEAWGTDDVVSEYEDRYYGHARSRLASPGASHDSGPYIVPPPRKPKRWHDPASISTNERKWAALAHGSTLLTALVALASGGLGVLLTMLVPLLIYFSFRKRSEFVAFHALQAFTMQLIGTIGWLALVIVSTIVTVALIFISIILMILLIGFVLAPFIILAYLALLVGSLLLPIGMVIYAVIATLETWHGKNYRYPFIARWVESQMYSDL